MKKALPLAIAFLFVTALAQAQIEKGSVLLGGNISFGNSENANIGYYKHNYVSINPAVGVAVKTNVVVGITASYGHLKYSSDSLGIPQSSTSAGGSVFLRRYFPIAKNFYLYGQGDLGYSYYHSEEGIPDISRDFVSNKVSVIVVPGIAYNVSRTFQLELGLSNLLEISYAKTKIETSGFSGAKTVKGHAFGAGTSLSSTAPIYIGFRVLFAK